MSHSRRSDFDMFSCQKRIQALAGQSLYPLFSRISDKRCFYPHQILRYLILIWIVIACSTLPPAPHLQPSTPLLGPYTYTPSTSHRPTGKIIFSDTQFPNSVNPLFAASTADFAVRNALWAAPIVYDQNFRAHPD